MYAIVNVAGEQIKVFPNTLFYAPSSSHAVGQLVTFKEVLLIKDDQASHFGKPFLEGAEVEAKVIKHFRDDKIIVFKKKRRKGYKKKQGHRQGHTQWKIEKIALNK